MYTPVLLFSLCSTHHAQILWFFFIIYYRRKHPRGMHKKSWLSHVPIFLKLFEQLYWEAAVSVFTTAKTPFERVWPTFEVWSIESTWTWCHAYLTMCGTWSIGECTSQTIKNEWWCGSILWYVDARRQAHSAPWRQSNVQVGLRKMRQYRKIK